MSCSNDLLKSQAQQKQLILRKFHSFEFGSVQFFAKIENLSIHQIFN